MKTKNPGAATLIVSVIMSGLILTVGLGLARLLSTELQFSADLMLGERAYFAAESGVETALWALQKNDDNSSQDPVNFVTDDDDSGIPAYGVPGGSSFALNIDNNHKESFEETFLPHRPIKLLLRRDTDPKLSTEMKAVTALNITHSGGENAPLDWKILCPDGVALQASKLENAGNLESFSRMNGTFDNGTDTPTTKGVEAFLAGVDDSTKCYLSITSFDTEKDVKTTLRFEAEDGIPPSAPLVTARGIAGNREKEVSFRYRQKNLSELFGFGLFHEGN